MSVRIQQLTLLLLGMLSPNLSHAHPPVPLDEWSAQAAIDNLEVSINHKTNTINRLLTLEGDTAERILRSAQESWLNGDYARAAKKLMSTTMVPGFKDHPARAALYQWLGISYQSLGFATLAKEAWITSLAEPRQTETTRIQTTTHLLKLHTRLPAQISRTLWHQRTGLVKRQFEVPSTYVYCRALYRSQLLKEASQCFESSMPNTYDSVRSQYFLGVIALIDRTYKKANTHFLKAMTTAQAELKPPEIDEMTLERSTSAVEIQSGTVDEQHDPAWLDIHIRSHLALARLAAAQEKWHSASLHYHHILPGHPTFFEASRERALVFDRLRKPRRAAASLVGVGQASTATGTGLKQSMWRAELLGRGEAYTEAQDTYDHIDRHTQRMAPKLLTTDATSKTQVQLQWLAPDLGLQFADLTQEIKTLKTTFKILKRDISTALKTVQTTFKFDQRSEEITELQHRLKDIKKGMGALINASPSFMPQIERLERALSRLTRLNDQLREHNAVFAVQSLNAISTSVKGHGLSLVHVQDIQLNTEHEINLATQGLLNTLETQAGLGKLNIYVWKKDAITRKIAQSVEAKHAEVRWIESEDPSVSPQQY